MIFEIVTWFSMKKIVCEMMIWKMKLWYHDMIYEMMIWYMQDVPKKDFNFYITYLYIYKVYKSKLSIFWNLMNLVINGAYCAQFVQISENLGVSKKMTIFPTFLNYFLFSHKLIKYFMKVVANSFVIVIVFSFLNIFVQTNWKTFASYEGNNTNKFWME